MLPIINIFGKKILVVYCLIFLKYLCVCILPQIIELAAAVAISVERKSPQYLLVTTGPPQVSLEPAISIQSSVHNEPIIAIGAAAAKL